jgi:hypothetical protein
LPMRPRRGLPRNMTTFPEWNWRNK